MIYYISVKGHQTTLKWFCDTWGKALSENLQYLTYEELSTKHTLPTGTYIFSDIERLNSSETGQAAQVWRALKERGHGSVLLNDPACSMRRYELLRNLHECKMNSFNAYRLTEAREPERYPVFLRRENDHRGPISPLLFNFDELQKAIEALVDSGDHRENKLIIEYVDTSNSQGHYHLYGAFIVGAEIIPAYLDFAQNWVVKGEANFGDFISNPEYQESENRYVKSNPHEQVLRGVFEKANIQYGRMDYAMVDGKICVFEINTNPVILEFLDVGGEEYLPAARHFSDRFIHAMANLDSTSDSGKRVRVGIKIDGLENTISLKVRTLIHNGLKLLGLLRFEATVDVIARRIRSMIFKP